MATSRFLVAASAALLAAAAPRAQVVFDSFDDGDVTDIGVFSQNNGGIGVGTTDGRTGAANTALSVGLNPAAAGAFAGFVVPGTAGVTDVSGTRTLSFYLRPTTFTAANVPLTLEINLHEDTNNNGTYEGATEDEFQAVYRVTPGTGYSFVSIPLASFTDDNAVFPGADNGFDFTKLLEIVVAVGQPVGPELTLAFDDFVFQTSSPTFPNATVLDNFNDGDVSDVFVFSGGAGGIGVGPTDDRSGTPGRALNVGIDPAGTGAFAGFVVTGGAGVTNAAGASYLTFQIRPTVAAGNLPLTLEINLHEDTNGNGTYEGATEDEFQAVYRVTGSSAFTTVAIPLAAFTDDNAVFAGANDGFDFSKVLELVIAIGQPVGPGYAISFDEFVFGSGAAVAGAAAPTAVAAGVRAFPNPAAARTTVAFDLAEATTVSVDVLDALGRRVAVAAEGAMAAGPAEVSVSTAGLAPGVYVVRVQAAGTVSATRLTVVR